LIGIWPIWPTVCHLFPVKRYLKGYVFYFCLPHIRAYATILHDCSPPLVGPLGRARDLGMCRRPHEGDHRVWWSVVGAVGDLNGCNPVGRIQRIEYAALVRVCVAEWHAILVADTPKEPTDETMHTASGERNAPPRARAPTARTIQAAQERQARRDHRVARYEEARRLSALGWSLRAIARTMHLNRQMVYSYLTSDSTPILRPRAPSEVSLIRIGTTFMNDGTRAATMRR